MPRPRKPRFVQCDATATYFKPRGIPLSALDEVTLSLDGLEALRLADVVGLDQTAAAAEMGISRSTFSRLVAEARRVVATALTQGAAIRVEGGPIARRADAPPPCRRRRGGETCSTGPDSMAAPQPDIDPKSDMEPDR